jgi:4-amino-4-deoxy-L-arabinose transferase-like glycosyltransferase
MRIQNKWMGLNLEQRVFAYRVRPLFRILAISLAGLHTWAAITSQSMNADGIAYLDIGDAYFRADWENAINPVWPPLYSWLLGLVNAAFEPSMIWEFPTAHILNFFIYLGAMVSFEFMWGKLRNTKSSEDQNEWLSLPSWAWWALGYSLFIWTSLSMIQIWAVTPDMLMAALLFLAAGLFIEIRKGSSQWRTFFFLGLVLGLGYLSKTFMFSIALVFLGMCLILVPRTWRSMTKVVFSAGIFLLVCLPYILLISEKSGKLTIGEAGTVTYVRYVHGVPFPHWQGDPSNHIILSHPTRLIHQSPPIYEFGDPIGGTYPVSTNPAYWYEGIQIRFDPGNQLARLLASSLVYLELFFQEQGLLLASVIALYAMGQRQKFDLTVSMRRWALVLPALTAFGLYGLVLVAGRYIGVFVLLLWADILANIRLPDVERSRSWLNILSGIAILGILVNIILFNLEGYNRLNPSIQPDAGQQVMLPPSWPGEVALALHQQGVPQGEKVGIIGYGFDSFWARLARVKIVAEMLESDANLFWLGEEDLQQSVLQAFASTGASAVVAEYVPGYARLEGWLQVSNSNYFIYKFEE